MKALFALLLGCLSLQLQAQTLAIVPFPPGGGLDALTRIIAQGVGEVVVENRAGANGLIGAKAVAAGKPDGRMWLFADASTMTVNPTLYPKDPAFDAHRDLRAVLALGFMPSVMTVHPTLGPKTLKEFIELARKQDIAYVSGGIGATGHLSMEYFGSVAGGQEGKLQLRHIPYKGGAPAMTDHIGGQVPAGFGVLAGALPHIRSGKIVALAVAGRQRTLHLPNVPTVGESGYPGFEVEVGYFVMVSSKVPDSAVLEVEARIRRVLADADAQSRIRVLGIEPAPGMSASEGARWIAQEQDKWSKVIREKGIRAE